LESGCYTSTIEAEIPPNVTNASVRSVASVTVATNAATALPRQIDALLHQTLPLQEIVVVDNNSSDGTAEMLRQRYPQVMHLRLPSNQGVGGAQAAGLEYAALQKKRDLVWILDDDSVPAPDALEKLLDASRAIKGAGEKIGILASLPVDTSSGQKILGWMWCGGFVEPGPEVLRERFWHVDAVISSGSLIGREVVERVGLPRADFFMDFVDYEYCLRIRRLGYSVVIVPESLLNHALGEARQVKFLGRPRFWHEHAAWREYYIWRNPTFAIWHLYPGLRSKFFFVRKFLRHAAGVALFNQEKRTSLRLMTLGFWDGFRGRLGIRFVAQPGCESRDFPIQNVPTRACE